MDKQHQKPHWAQTWSSEYTQQGLGHDFSPLRKLKSLNRGWCPVPSCLLIFLLFNHTVVMGEPGPADNRGYSTWFSETSHVYFEIEETCPQSMNPKIWTFNTKFCDCSVPGYFRGKQMILFIMEAGVTYFLDYSLVFSIYPNPTRKLGIWRAQEIWRVKSS